MKFVVVYKSSRLETHLCPKILKNAELMCLLISMIPTHQKDPHSSYLEQGSIVILLEYLFLSDLG